MVREDLGVDGADDVLQGIRSVGSLRFHVQLDQRQLRVVGMYEVAVRVDIAAEVR